ARRRPAGRPVERGHPLLRDAHRPFGLSCADRIRPARGAPVGGARAGRADRSGPGAADGVLPAGPQERSKRALLVGRRHGARPRRCAPGPGRPTLGSARSAQSLARCARDLRSRPRSPADGGESARRSGPWPRAGARRASDRRDERSARHRNGPAAGPDAGRNPQQPRRPRNRRGPGQRGLRHAEIVVWRDAPVERRASRPLARLAQERRGRRRRGRAPPGDFGLADRRPRPWRSCRRIPPRPGLRPDVEETLVLPATWRNVVGFPWTRRQTEVPRRAEEREFAMSQASIDPRYLEVFPQWLRGLGEDAGAVGELLASDKGSDDATRSLVSGLNYIFKSLDLIPDGIDDLGFLDD